MLESDFRIISNRRIADTIYELVLEGDTGHITAPGQFVNVMIPDFYLRRPISVCDVRDNRLVLVYKTVGKGTAALSEVTEGELNLLSGLGNGYDTSCSGDSPVLIGGGVGIPPLYYLCRKLRSEGKRPHVVLGFRNISEVFYEDRFREIAEDVTVTTDDGSYGTKGFVTDVLDDGKYSYFYTCGPYVMMKNIASRLTCQGQLSFEERMGCGFGACMGCSMKTASGNKRVCKDGPVFRREDILWKD